MLCPGSAYTQGESGAPFSLFASASIGTSMRHLASPEFIICDPGTYVVLGWVGTLPIRLCKASASLTKSHAKANVATDLVALLQTEA